MGADDVLRRFEKLFGGGPGPRDPGPRPLRLFEPRLEHLPRPLAGLVAPLVAACALALLAGTVALGAVGLGLLLVAVGLAYAILRQVFGLRLDLQMPGP